VILKSPVRENRTPGSVRGRRGNPPFYLDCGRKTTFPLTLVYENTILLTEWSFLKNLLLHELVASCEGFDWDPGNDVKNWSEHHVSQNECETIFLNDPLIKNDKSHSLSEKRYYAVGKTEQERYLFVAYTIRKKLIRIISARDAARLEFQEYRIYEKKASKI